MKPTEQEQIQQLGYDIDELIGRYRGEHQITYAAAVGVLQMKIYMLCDEACGQSNEVT